ncbi:MAG TPA: PDZ domain-containing protein, partial [Verrucomicrobiae bacterium]|nr:PDZ domain-containing protein [Verrucomicrobiae bacterium]
MRLDRRAVLGMVGASPVLASLPATASTPASEDAQALIDLIFAQYAYRERLEGFPRQRLQEMRAQAESVATARDLVRFGERALTAIFDHHAILNSSRADSYGLTPSFADMWIESRDGRFVVTDVRHNSPAERGGVRPGDALVGVGGQSTDEAIAAFIEAPRTRLTPQQQAHCARTLAAGRRDQPRNLVFVRSGRRRALALANLYAAPIERGEGPLSVRREGAVAVIRINDALGDDSTIAAFDAAMGASHDASGIVIDLRDTASGGNTFVARAMMGW